MKIFFIHFYNKYKFTINTNSSHIEQRHRLTPYFQPELLLRSRTKTRNGRLNYFWLIFSFQWRMQNPAKYLTWSFLQN